MTCRYFDAGWCYAPEDAKNNSIQGGCFEPEYCATYLMQNKMTDFQPTPQHPEEVANGLREAFRQAKKDGVMDATPYLEKWNSYDGLSVKVPKQSGWKCYLFGNRPGGNGIMYVPSEGRVPNRFVRFMMRICFDCLWVKDT